MALQFDDYTVEQAQHLDKEVASSASWMKLKPGRNILRFIPGRDGNDPFTAYWRHYVQKPDGTSVSFACPSRSASKPCPVCEHGNRLQNSGSKADQKLASQFWPGKTILANVIDRDDPEAGPKILRMGKKIVGQLTSIRKNEETGGNYFHPINGFDICIERTGTTKNDTDYKVQASRKTTPLGPDDDTMQTWIDTVHDLAEFAALKTPDEIREMLSLDGGSSQHGADASAQSKLPGLSDDDFAIDVDAVDGF